MFDEKAVKRFESYYSLNDKGCWQWEGSTNHLGYGVFYYRRKVVKSHRFSYELHKEKIPTGLVIDHLCRNRGCVNPEHMEAVTQQENILRGTGPTALNARKTHCKRGHELSPLNKVGKPSWRDCTTCRADYQNEANRLLRIKNAERKAKRRSNDENN